MKIASNEPLMITNKNTRIIELAEFHKTSSLTHRSVTLQLFRFFLIEMQFECDNLTTTTKKKKKTISLNAFRFGT